MLRALTSAWPAVLACAAMAAVAAQDHPAPPDLGHEVPAAEASAAAAPPADLVEAVEAVRAEVAALCGAPFSRAVPTAVLDADGMRAWAAKRVDLELADGRLERLDAWLHCLQLLPPDRSFRAAIAELMGSMVLGFFDSESKRLYLLSSCAELGMWYTRFTAAHELTHAWDDQRVDLLALLRPDGRDATKDELLTRTALAEGSAMAVADRWAAQHPPSDQDLDQVRRAKQADNGRVMAAMTAAPRYCTLQMGKHTIGRAFFAASAEWRDRGAPPLSLAALTGDLPASTEQILHPAKYWDPERRDLPVELENAAQVSTRIAAETGRTVMEQNTLGELVVALLALPPDHRLRLGPHQRPEYWTNAAATGWGGDRLFLLGAGGGAAGETVDQPGVVWITAWDTERDREEFVAAIAEHRSGAVTATASRGRTAAFAFGTVPKVDAAALQQLLDRCRFRQGSADWQP